MKTVKEAEAPLVTDPAVAAGRFIRRVRLVRSAAMMEITSIHNRIDKTGR